MVLSVVLYQLFLKRFAAQPLRQVLFTFGTTLVVAESARHIWGGYPVLLATPSYLHWTIVIGSVTLPAYRAFVIAIAITVGAVLWIVLSRTRAGALVRACIDDREIASTMGIDVDRVFTIMFGFAGFLAGIAGGVGGPFIGAYQGVQFDILTLTLVVVVIGGLGSVLGALLGSVLIGIIYFVGVGVAPQLSYFLLFGPMILILSIRPTGLLGRAS
jgi:branched-chain amino acid transport system permease protein